MGEQWIKCLLRNLRWAFPAKGLVSWRCFYSGSGPGVKGALVTCPSALTRVVYAGQKLRRGRPFYCMLVGFYNTG